MTTPQKLETVRRIQIAMSAAYMGMGSWCLLHPSSVIRLSLTAPYPLVNPTTSLIMRCFGAQAMTSGLLFGVAPMNARAFNVFALAMVPFLGFNAWFIVGPGRGVFTSWLLMDFVGNMFYAVGSVYCAKLLGEDEKEKGE